MLRDLEELKRKEIAKEQRKYNLFIKKRKEYKERLFKEKNDELLREYHQYINDNLLYEKARQKNGLKTIEFYVNDKYNNLLKSIKGSEK